MFEQVKDYESACAVLGRKPIDKHMKLEKSVLIYDSLVEMPQNMQLKLFSHCI